ncbi:MAG: hypothetical protein RID07_02915, partial [Lacipirellulaceae bacterium]
MAWVSHPEVDSGYFRNHLYVILGLATLAALLAISAVPPALAWAIVIALLSYVGAILWLYEKPLPAKWTMWIVALLSAVALLLTVRYRYVPNEPTPTFAWQGLNLQLIQAITSACLIGSIMAAMLLGHWYLNAPGMKIRPLQGMLITSLVAWTLHSAVSGLGLALEYQQLQSLSTSWVLFALLRWLCLLGIVGLIYMTWQTLKIPNTQSATGILYVDVIAVFTVEIASLVLSAESTFPV